MAALFAHIPQNLVDYTLIQEPRLNSLKQEHIRLLVSLCLRQYFEPKRFKHKQNRQSFYIPYGSLQGAFGRKYLEIFKQSGLITVAMQPNQAAKITRGYQLTDKAIEILDTYYETPKEKTKILTSPSHKGNSFRKNKVTGEYCAILSRDTSGNMATCKEQINAVVNIDLGSLERLKNAIRAHIDKLTHNVVPNIITSDYKAIEALIKGYQKTKAVEWLKRRLKSICAFIYDANVNDKLVTGQLIQQYEQCKTGRLYGFGVHLQSAPKEVKRAAFKSCFDYDFNNCHFAIISQLAKRNAIETPYIDDYLVNKSLRRKELAELTQKPIERIKKCLISLIYGSSINLHHKTAIVETVGIRAAETLVKNELFKGLYNDISRARKAIIESHKGKGGVFNAVSKKLKPSDDIDPLSFIIQGYEAKMLELAINLFGADIVLLQHDGFTTKEKINTDALIDGIRQSLGFEISLSCDAL